MLVAQRPPGKHLAGRWEFPGGKLEPGETPEAAVVRELAEELAIECDIACLAPAGFASHDYGDFHLVLLLFVLRKWRGSPAGPALRWVRLPELFGLDMPPADKPLLGLLSMMV